MKALRILKPGDVRIVDIPKAEIKNDNEVLIKVKVCVTCPQWDITVNKGIDIFEREGYPRYPFLPGYPGHEMSGDVIAIGKEVKNFKEGDRVATIIATGDTEMGFYVEYINRPESTITKFPDNISYEAAASMEMARFVSPYLRMLGDINGLRIGVVGLGPAGLIAMQMLKARGAKEVIAFDINDDRLEIAKNLGADQVINPLNLDALKVLSGNMLQGCVDCSGSSSGFQIALDYTKNGTVSIFGVLHGTGEYTTKHWRNKVSIAKRISPDESDTEFVIDLWKEKKLDTDILISKRLPIERYTEGIQLLNDKKAIKVGYFFDK